MLLHYLGKIISSFQRFERCFSGNMWVAVKRVGFFGTEMRMQTWRWTELLQMLEVTTNGSHAGRKALGEVFHHLVDVFSWQLFPDGLQSDFQLISRLGLRLEFMVLF